MCKKKKKGARDAKSYARDHSLIMLRYTILFTFFSWAAEKAQQLRVFVVPSTKMAVHKHL